MAALVEAQLPQNRAVCWPSVGGGVRIAAGVSDSFSGDAEHADRPGGDVVERDDHLARGELRIGERFGDGADRAARHAGRGRAPPAGRCASTPRTARVSSRRSAS